MLYEVITVEQQNVVGILIEPHAHDDEKVERGDVLDDVFEENRNADIGARIDLVPRVLDFENPGEKDDLDRNNFV